MDVNIHIYSFAQHIFIKHLVGARHHVRWQDTVKSKYGVTALMEERHYWGDRSFIKETHNSM